MAAVDLQQLVKRLDADALASIEGAAAMAVRHAHDRIEFVHWLASMAQLRTFLSLLDETGVSPEAFAQEVSRELSQLRPGKGGTPAFDPMVIAAARDAWVVASLQNGRERIGLSDILLAIVNDASFRSLARSVVPSLRTLNGAKLEEVVAAASSPVSKAPETGAPRTAIAPSGGEDFLAAYAHDMTADARAGRIDPVVGRDDELRQVIDVLLRRRQNNPILVGEAGVGKTAIAEAFALRLAGEDVPHKLRGVRLLSLDLALLQAGAGVKGEFERRLRGVVDAVKASPEPIILFIDEAHGLVGAGNQAGQGDAANILKPALARGELRTIAATTWGEYKRYFERDAALTRRFQPVNVGEPNEETAVRMLRGIVDLLQSHHGVRIRDEALRAAVRLSTRYIPARQLPDKAVSLIDTAAASVAFSRDGVPAALEALLAEHRLLLLEQERLSREPSSDELEERLDAIAARLPILSGEIEALESKLDTERTLVARADAAEDDAAAAPGSVQAVMKRLSAAQGETALIHRVVDAEAVAAVVARWTGVPVGRLVSDQVTAAGELGPRLKARVIGQDHALDALAAAMRVARARLTDPRRPPGVFLMVGMSGVGKTETALALADILYGGPQSLTTINMSEFKEEHKVSMLLGSPPGYVGYGEGGVLTEAVRRRPYGVLLLDEIDKAHPGVQDVFYQLFDKGSLRDGEGRDIDFKNTTILMTANTGSDMLAALAADPETMPEPEQLADVLKPALLSQFKPAFLGRTTVLAYQPLSDTALKGIVDLQIARVADRVVGTYGAVLTLTEAARSRLLTSAKVSDTGARAVETLIARDLLPVLSEHLLNAVVAGTAKKAFAVDVDDDRFVVRVTADPQTPFAEKSAELAASRSKAKEPEPVAV